MRTEEIRRERSPETNTAPLSPSEAIPLLRAAADESRPELQELWARLLANAMDPQKPQITRVLIKVLQELDVLEARILQRLSDEDALDKEVSFIDHVRHVNWRPEFEVSADQFTITINRLVDLNILDQSMVLHLQLSGPKNQYYLQQYNIKEDDILERNVSMYDLDEYFKTYENILMPYKKGLPEILKLSNDGSRFLIEFEVIIICNIVGVITMRTLGRELLRSLSLIDNPRSRQSRPRRRRSPRTASQNR